MVNDTGERTTMWLEVTGAITVVLVTALCLIKKEASKRRSNADGEGTKGNEDTIDKTKYPGGAVKIYYATQTGTAESFAQQLEREGPDHGFLISIVDMEEVEQLEGMWDPENKNLHPEKAMVLAATYGEGEPTDSSAQLVQAMKQALEEDSDEGEGGSPKDIFKGLEFCVFGLGNKQYEHYNAMGHFFDTSMEKLGGSRIMDIGLGDDDADLEADFESWKEQMWTTLKNKYCKDSVLPIKEESDHFSLPDCEYAIEYHKESPAVTTSTSIPLNQVHGSCRPFFTAVNCPVTTVRELRSEKDDGSTKHVEIDISNAKDLVYETADNLGVLPVNNPKIVESVANSLNYNLEDVFSLHAAPNHEWHGAPFPMPLSVRECLTSYLDLTSAPRRSDLKLLAQYATDPLDRRALLRLSSKEGKAEYKEKVMEGYVGMVELLKLCPSLSIPLEHLISNCHFLLPRFYTIASSSSVHPKSVHLTVAVTQEKRKDGTMFCGVCSTYLARLKPGVDQIRVFNRPSTFRLPEDATKPIIMIGPGTGIAPMRALLQERRYQKMQLKKSVGTNILYFGCKSKDMDYLYEKELEEFRQDGTLNQLYLAFSRETKQKVYVQHLLSQNAKETWDWIDAQKASIYVCGGAKMGHDVMETFKEHVVSKHGGMSLEEAKEYLGSMSKQGRFVQELWT